MSQLTINLEATDLDLTRDALGTCNYANGFLKPNGRMRLPTHLFASLAFELRDKVARWSGRRGYATPEMFVEMTRLSTLITDRIGYSLWAAKPTLCGACGARVDRKQVEYEIPCGKCGADLSEVGTVRN